MSKATYLIMGAAMFFGSFFMSNGGQPPVKKAMFAGAFYEADPVRLGQALDSYLVPGPAAAPGGRIMAIIVPHAGYVYSGPTAGKAYALLKGKDYRTVVVIGPSHRVGFPGCSIWPEGAFETPLGRVEVDGELAKALIKASGFPFLEKAFAEEHSVEVQLPFIQKVLPGAKIVPIVMGYQEEKTIDRLGAALAKACRDRKDILVVASTDMSHYLPKAEAAKVDAETIELIQALNIATITSRIEAGENFMCGAGPVAAALRYASKVGKPQVDILARDDSSAAGGPVVGYMAAAVFDSASAAATAEEPSFTLSDNDKQVLLRTARRAISAYLETGRVIDEDSGLPALKTPLGAFVTLKKNGELRGCIGYSEPVEPLGRAVIDVAIYAAVRDPRFEPVTAGELQKLKIEISVLTPLHKIAPAKVVVGRHGLLIRKGGRSGLLLPQVPVEQGWDRETFLEEVCIKAGLPTDAWKTGAELQAFEAIVFGE